MQKLTPFVVTLGLISLLGFHIPAASAHFSNPNLVAPVTNGTVNSIAYSDSYVAIGGSFSVVGPTTGSGVPTATSGAGPMSFNTLDKIDESVYSVVVDGAGGWYVGGEFANVGDTALNRLAHILPDGSVDGSWNPDVNNIVRAMALDSAHSVLYIGGDFTTVGGTTRNRLAAVNLSDGTVSSWNPNANNVVRTMGLTADGSILYVGGDFTSLGGTTRHYLGAYTTADGARTSWNPDSDSTVNVLAVRSNGNVYAGGSFNCLLGLCGRDNLAEIQPNGSLTSWNPKPNGVVLAMALNADESTIYLGGDFTGFSLLGLNSRNHAGAVNVANDTVTSWNPNFNNTVRALTVNALGTRVYAGGDFTKVGGVSKRSNAASVDADSGDYDTAWSPRVNGAVRAVLLSTAQTAQDTIYLAGDLTSLGGIEQDNLALFDRHSGAVLDWDPSPDATVNTVAWSSDATTLYVGGDFLNIGGAARNRLAAIDFNSATATSWNPNVNNTVNHMAITSDNATIYAAGTFTQIGGTTRNRVASIKASDGTLNTFDPNANNTVNKIRLTDDGSTLYLAGTFTQIGGTTRNRAGAVLTSNASLTSFNPNAGAEVKDLALSPDGTTAYLGGSFTSVGGSTRNRLASVNASSGALNSWNPNVAGGVGPVVNSVKMSPDNRTVFAGGAFSTVGGSTRNRLAAIKVSDATLTTWNPNPDNSVNTILVSPSQGAELFVGGTFKKMDGDPFGSSADFGSPRISFTIQSDVEQNIPEASGTANLEVQLTAPNTIDTTVDFAWIAGGEAVLGTDFSLSTSPLVIAAGQMLGNIVVTITNDTTQEPPELLFVQLSNPKNAIFDPTVIDLPTNRLSIIDND